MNWRSKWSIAIYTGDSPFRLSPASGIQNPVIRADTVTDIPARSVADPFLLRRDGLWNLFFEVWNADTNRGELAHATSEDGLRWTYGSVVLREPFHLSYPHVFAYEGRTYMIPETREANAIRLYEAAEFPHRWRFVRTLREGPYADSTVTRYAGRWWMFAQRGLDELRLFSSDAIDGDWKEHPKSPLWAGNRRFSRPGGRMLEVEGRLHRFTQDGLPTYGHSLRVFAIDRLTESEYEEHEIPGSPILEASRVGWNAMAMHHADVQPLSGGGWLAAVDGATVGMY
jgi:hypothetical protein